MGIH